MSIAQPKPDYILTVYIFLGSATFTALFFILQSKNIVTNYDFFVASVGIASILFILLIVARLNISNGRIKPDTDFAQFVGWLGIAGFVWIIFIIIALISEINYIVGFIVGMVSLAFYLTMEITIRRSK